MFNSYRGDVVLGSSPGVAPGFAHSVTRDTSTGVIYLKAVNGQATPLTVKIEIAGVASADSEGRQIVLTSANPTDTNSLHEPEKIVPVESALTGVSRNFAHTFPAYSITVLQLQAH
jgi:alpha-N-arabinofuranosidase